MIRLGTRRSALATAQANHVADRLRALGHEVELVLVTTTGDTNRAPLEQIGGTGVFVSALRDGLLANEIDIAVHSLKDLPTAPIEGLTLGAIPQREDPRDVLVARDGLITRRTADRSAGGHRLTAPGGAAGSPRARPRTDRDPRQRGHQDRHGRRRQIGRGGARKGRVGPVGPAFGGHRDAGSDPGAAGTGTRCPGHRMPRRRRRGARGPCSAGGCRRPRRGDGRTADACHARGRVHGSGRRTGRGGRR